jgi:hypothetical protein
MCGYQFSPEYDCVERGCCWTEGGLAPSGSSCNFRQNATRLQAFEAVLDPTAMAAPPQDRHLYVNGQRAFRSRINDPTTAFVGSNLSADGIFTTAAEVANWTSGAELVWPQTTSPWTEPRCTVDNVTQACLCF